MILLLVYIPGLVTVVLGIPFLFLSSARPAIKLAGVLVFAAAVYLQFFGRHNLAGLLIQIGLAVSLALWRRMDTGSI